MALHGRPDSRRILLFSAPDRATLIARLEAVGEAGGEAGGEVGGGALGKDVPPAPKKAGDPCRLALLPGPRDEGFGKRLTQAITKLKASDAPRFSLAGGAFFADRSRIGATGRTAILFPGFGARHPRMVGDLLDHFDAARRWFDALPETQRRHLFDNPLIRPKDDAPPETFAQSIEAVLVGSLCLHAVVTTLCPSLPQDVMVGHSYGEIALLSAAGMVSGSADALALAEGLVSVFGDLGASAADSQRDTGMLAITAGGRPAFDKRVAAGHALTVALDNCPQQLVVSGAREDLAALEAELRERGQACFRLPELVIPVHTPHFPLSSEALAAIYRTREISPPTIPSYSCASADRFPDDPEGLRALMVAQWFQPMRFRETIERLYTDGIRRFIEIGPGGHLSGFVRDTLRGHEISAIAANLESRDTLEQLYGLLGRLFVDGHDLVLDPEAEAPSRDAAPQVADTPSSPGDRDGDGDGPSVFPNDRTEGTVALLRRLVAEILETDDPDLIDREHGFFDLGLRSIDAVALVEHLSAVLDRPLPQTLAFDYPTIDGLARHLAGENRPAPVTHTAQRSGERAGDGDIAVIGIGCRLPGGIQTPDAFWAALTAGRDVVSTLPEGRWDLDDIRAAGINPQATPQIFHGAFLDAIDRFDPAFFGISPREALSLDPQQRLLLEVTRETLEHGCLPPGSLRNSRTGVFVGIASSDYAQRLPMVDRLAIGGYLGSGNAQSTAAGRLSFVFGFNGPCIAVDTACSSSLVAVHLAVQSLRRRESDLALAGGVSLMISPETSLFLARAGALSPTGRCHAFDADADGYVRGEGCAMVALKRLEDARADGDSIQGVILGTAINHDGRTSGLTVPNGVAQQDLVQAALADANLTPNDIGYLEAHGTGTALGDPIEAHALGAVFSGRPAEAPLVLGTVKSNLGHLEAAAGVVGLIKAVFQAQKGEFVSTPNPAPPNPRIQWRDMPLSVCTARAPWPADGQGRRIAGVSSFGISGTNAHAIVAAPPQSPQKTGVPPSPRRLPLALSARSASALEQLRDQVVNRLEQGDPSDDIHDLSISSILGRDALEHRMAIVAATAAEAAGRLTAARPQAVPRRPSLVFLYSGQGAQTPEMGQGLYAQEPVFREAVDRCARLLDPLLDQSITDLMFSGGDRLHATCHAQPTLFTLQYALDALLGSWGVTPTLVLGHSVGEIAAAHRAGILDLEDAARLVAARGRLMQSLPAGGAMTVLARSEAHARRFLDDHGLSLSIAAVNGPQMVVLSGAEAEIEKAEAALVTAGGRRSRLTVSHAFHSHLMDPILTEFRTVAESLSPRPPRLPMISSLTGRVLDTAPGADYWVDQLRGVVRFADALGETRNRGATAFLELGPRPVLSALVEEALLQAPPTPGAACLVALRPGEEDSKALMTAMAGLHQAGVGIDWRAVQGRRPWRRDPLPPTPFDRRRFWIEGSRTAPSVPPSRPLPFSPQTDAACPTGPPPDTASTIPRVLRRLRETAPEKRADFALYQVRRTLSTVLGGAAPETLDPHDPLTRFGLDSIMALGLRRELAADFGLDIPLTRLVGEETVDSLSKWLLRRFADGDKDEESASPPASDPGAKTHLGPPSHGQSALWFVWHLSPLSSAYTLSLAMNLPAPATEEAWKRAANALLAAHPMLRARFPRTDGEVRWIIDETAAADWRVTKAEDLDNTALKSALQTAHDAPFNLETGPICRFHWFALKGGGARLLVMIHHIAADGWSLELIRRQLPILAAGQAIPAAPGYPDHIRAERAMIEGPEGARRLAYWRARLADLPPVAEPPTDLARPAEKTFKGFGRPVALSLDVSAKLHALARDRDCTPFIVSLAAYLAFLHRLTGQEDLIVGTPHAGRDRSGADHLVGYFVEPVPVRSTSLGNETFAAFLSQTRAEVLSAFDHRLPFALLVEKLRLPRDPGRSPLFDLSFNFISAEAEVDFGVLGPNQADGKFDMTLSLQDGEQITGWLGLDAALFTPAGADRLTATFVAFVSALAERADQPLARITLTEPGRPLLRGTPPEEPLDSLLDRVTATADRDGEAPAVVATDGQLTYRALVDRVEDLAAQLKRMDLPPGARVGVAARRETAFIQEILACHRSGVTPVLLDPDWPDPVTEAVLATAGLAARIDGGRPVVEADIHGDHAPATAHAYVVFTSGTTGIPKGVIVPHQAMDTYMIGMSADLGFEPGGQFAHVSSPAADLGMTMVLGALATGGCLHMVPKDICLDPPLFHAYLKEQRIDYLKITPSHLSALTETDLSLPCRILVLGGESTTPNWVARLRKANPGCRVFNHYGPSETTIGVLSGELQTSDDLAPPLERVVMGSDIHLLTDEGLAVLPGAVGELVIGGRSLAVGYLGVDAEKQPGFTIIGGERLYRTGDLARHRADGRIEILGRRDRQVKVRGYRVDPFQIERILRDHPAVAQAHVMVLDDGLVAFVVEKTGIADSLPAPAVIAHLTGKVPTAMVPDRVLALANLPLTANGKIDETALRRIARAPSVTESGRRPLREAERQGPRDAVEQALAIIWSDLLGGGMPAMTDNFFDQGGHSLLAVRLMAHVTRDLGVTLPTSTILAHPTLESLAGMIRATSGSPPLSVPLRTGGERASVFMVPGAGGSPLYLRALATGLDTDRPVWGLRAIGQSTRETLPDTVEAVAAQYVEEILARTGAGPCHLAGHSFGALVAYEMARLLTARGGTVLSLNLLDNPAPIGGDPIPERDGIGWLRHIGLRIGKLADTPIDLAPLVEAGSYSHAVAHLARALTAARILPADLDPDHLARFVEVYRTNAVSAAHYRPPALATPIPTAVYRARLRDKELETSETTDSALSDTLGWETLLPCPPRAFNVSGTHLTMFNPPHVADLARTLSAHLRAVEARGRETATAMAEDAE